MIQTNVVAAVAPEADVPVTATVRVPGVRPVPVISPAGGDRQAGRQPGGAVSEPGRALDLQAGGRAAAAFHAARRNTWRGLRAWSAERMASPGRGQEKYGT
jgi:hypothetical protein